MKPKRVEGAPAVGEPSPEGALRDAIHIALLPCVASHDLWPGCKVAFVYGSTELIKSKHRADESVRDHLDGELGAIGVVDPFLDSPVRKGERCWVFMFPGTITGLRHEWEHLALAPSKPLAGGDSELWLRQFADKWNFHYPSMVAEASGEPGGYVVAEGIDLHSASEVGEGDLALFWHHIEVLAKRKFDEDHRGQFGWSCSC